MLLLKMAQTKVIQCLCISIWTSFLNKTSPCEFIKWWGILLSLHESQIFFFANNHRTPNPKHEQPTAALAFLVQSEIIDCLTVLDLKSQGTTQSILDGGLQQHILQTQKIHEPEILDPQKIQDLNTSVLIYSIKHDFLRYD